MPFTRDQKYILKFSDSFAFAFGLKIYQTTYDVMYSLTCNTENEITTHCNIIAVEMASQPGLSLWNANDNYTYIEQISKYTTITDAIKVDHQYFNNIDSKKFIANLLLYTYYI